MISTVCPFQNGTHRFRLSVSPFVRFPVSLALFSLSSQDRAVCTNVSTGFVEVLQRPVLALPLICLANRLTTKRSSARQPASQNCRQRRRVSLPFDGWIIDIACLPFDCKTSAKLHFTSGPCDASIIQSRRSATPRIL